MTWNRRKTMEAVNRHLLLLSISLLFLLPIIWMVSTSLKPKNEVFVFPPRFFTLPLVFDNYPQSLQFIDFWRYFFNTMVISVLSVVGTLVSCPIAAYGFSRLQWSLREPLFFMCLSTIMLPFVAVMVPTYVLFHSFGWIGNPNILAARGRSAPSRVAIAGCRPSPLRRCRNPRRLQSPARFQ